VTVAVVTWGNRIVLCLAAGGGMVVEIRRRGVE